MAKKTNIEWCNHTFNPWIGCHKVSEGCKHCYAETWALQKQRVTAWNKDSERKPVQNWLVPEKWNRNALAAKQYKTVFCASLSDVFEDRDDVIELRKDMWGLVKRTSCLIWMVLTKRPENIEKLLPEDWGEGYENVCLMVTAENQECFDKRVSILQGIPAKHRALSIEPLVGPINIEEGKLAGIDMVIVGGESGQKIDNIRPMNPAWVRQLRDDCAREEVPFFFKQWGSWGPNDQLAEKDLSNAAVFVSATGTVPFLLSELSTKEERQAKLNELNGEVVYRAWKKKTGSSLDGKEHKDHPFKDLPIPETALTTLSENEETKLVELEKTVSDGVTHFIEVGKALMEIRNQRLYRKTHTTFEDYCDEKWGFSRSEAYRQIQAAEVVSDLSITETADLPANASLTRSLSKLKSPDARRQAWGKARQVSPDSPVTAEVVKIAVDEIIHPSGERDVSPSKTKKKSKKKTKTMAKAGNRAPSTDTSAKTDASTSTVSDSESATDVTEAKPIREQLQALAEKLQRAMDEKADTVGPLLVELTELIAKVTN